MPVDTANREYRALTCAMAPVGGEGGGKSYRVSGYATTYGNPYALWEDPELGTLYERVERGAVDADTDLSDVIMQYDHSGRVLARTGNGTLELFPDDPHGLRVEADLSRSEAARQTFDEIEAGLVTRMSFAFTVDRDSMEHDRASRSSTRSISHIRKIYDVSAVSIPANDATEISARSLLDGAIGEALRESRRRARRLAAAAARLRLA